MSRMPRLSKSGIEYLDLAWNFYSGCLNWSNGICAVGKNCWAMRITQRFKQHYPNGFEPTFYPEAFLSPLSMKNPSRIGVAFMGDLFGDWVDPFKLLPEGYPAFPNSTLLLSGESVTLKDRIFETINQCPHHTFIFLTKCPWNLPKWSPFPDNAWVGVTATDDTSFRKALVKLHWVEALVKFISLEPFLSPIHENYSLQDLDWLVIGAQTNPARLPHLEWVEERVKACDKAGIPVFLKNNLHLDVSGKDTWALSPNVGKGELWRQEFPTPRWGSDAKNRSR